MMLPEPPLGIYRLHGNPESLDFTLEPASRVGEALADTFAVDATRIAGSFFKLQRVTRISNETLRLVFSFRHPLPDTASRLDLHLFDIRMHLLGTQARTATGGPGGLQVRTGAGGVEEAIRLSNLPVRNPNGWSTWGQEVVEPVVGTLPANCHPFWRFHIDSGRGTLDPANPVGWNVVPMRQTMYTAGVELDLTPGTTLTLYAALEAAYGASALGPRITPLEEPGGRLNPRYFNPEFNIKEAWDVAVQVTGTPIIGATSTSAQIALAIRDHQGALPASGQFDPLAAPAISLRYPSDLKEVQVAVPGILPVRVTLQRSAFTGQGTPGAPYQHTLNLTGDMFVGSPGTYLGLVAARDQMEDVAGSTVPLATLGIDRTLNARSRFDFAAYQLFLLTVEESSNQPPTAELTATPLSVPNCGTVQLSPGPGTGDPDGAIALYEYDFDYDGIIFTADASNGTGVPVQSGALCTPGPRTMALRVTDNGTPPLSAIATQTVTVQVPPNQPPTAVIEVTPLTIVSGGTVQCRPGTGTNDPDGAIVLYEYDFNFDGTFNVDASNGTGAPVITPPLPNPGAEPITRTMAMRVTDNGDPPLSALDTQDITINPQTGPTWTQIHQMIVNGDPNSAATACVSCHSFGSGGLTMNSDKTLTYNNLVGVMSSCGFPYVTPTNPGNSFMYEKISMSSPSCGSRMPWDGPPYWSPGAIQMVQEWILAGAPNN